MAEAAVEDRPTQKFYCHMCNVQFTNLPANFTCPHCLDGFIEELLDDPPSTSSSAPGASSATSEAQGAAGGSGSSNTEDWDTDDELFRMPPQRSRGEAGPQSSRHQSGSGGGGGGGFRRYQQDLPLEDIIQDVIRNWGQRFNYMPNLHLIMGNPDDYEWGNQQSLDAIVTQLLNQMENTGPPPLTKTEMDALPMVKCDHVQTDQKLQCSICWEEFKMDEHVRQLPCQHLYHALCIQPWLQLHATCPICRKRLFKRDSNGGEDEEEGEEEGDDNNGEGNHSNNSSNDGEDRDRDNNGRSSHGNDADETRSEFYDNDSDRSRQQQQQQQQVGHDPSTSASNSSLSNRTASDGDPNSVTSPASTRDGGGGGNSAASVSSPLATTNNRSTTGGVNTSNNSNSSRRSRGVTTRSSTSQSAMEH